VVCCQVLHLHFQTTQFCNMCVKTVSSAFMPIIVTVFSFTYHLFSWRLPTNDFQLPYYLHTLSLHWIWNLHYRKSSVYHHILCGEKNVFSLMLLRNLCSWTTVCKCKSHDNHCYASSDTGISAALKVTFTDL
jgi:hypothetical protein